MIHNGGQIMVQKLVNVTQRGWVTKVDNLNLLF
jgi:hypothetical protein